MLNSFLTRRVGFAAHNTILVDHKILLLETTGCVLCRAIPNTAAAADRHHLAAHLGKRSDVILTRRVVRRFDVGTVLRVLHRVLGILGIHHTKKVHVFSLTKQKIFF